MQSLYTFFSSGESDIISSRKVMLKNFDSVVDLKYSILSLIVEIINYAVFYYEDSKKKYLPTDEDLNPNTRLIDNQIIREILTNFKLNQKIENSSKIWLNNDHDIVRKIFSNIVKSDLYKNYLNDKDSSKCIDQKFIIDVMNEIVLNDKLVHHILEEQNIHWIDDLPFVASVIFGEIKDDSVIPSFKTFRHSSDKKFALDIFNNVIKHNNEYDKIIIEFANNWELDRIAKMDQIFLKMAFAEILTISELPLKVSLNEYIEISKYYSTSKSKLFVNGLLDNFVKTYTRNGIIVKN